MRDATWEDGTTTITFALRALESACQDLDNAVSALPDIGEDNAMASPGLVTLLLRVVDARHHLHGLEVRLAAHTQALLADRRS